MQESMTITGKARWRQQKLENSLVAVTIGKKRPPLINNGSPLKTELRKKRSVHCGHWRPRKAACLTWFSKEKTTWIIHVNAESS